jgi:hypothetical protein
MKPRFLGKKSDMTVEKGFVAESIGHPELDLCAIFTDAGDFLKDMIGCEDVFKEM